MTQQVGYGNLTFTHNESLHASVLVRGPKGVTLPVQHQFPLIGQMKTAHVAFVVFGGVCVPPGIGRLVVHDQVAVSLHAQADGVRAFGL